MPTCCRHYTPHTLALDLSEEVPPHIVKGRLDRCGVCRSAQDTLNLWARRIAHQDPAVWPEYATAPHLLAELLALPHSRRLALVRFDELYQHWGLMRLALEDSREVGYSSPTGARHLADVALAIAMNLPEEYYGAHTVADQRAIAWANLAHVQAAEEPEAARRSAEEAARWRGRGTGAADIRRHVEELLAVEPPTAGDAGGGVLADYGVEARTAAGGGSMMRLVRD